MELNTDKYYLRLNNQETNTLNIGDLHINNYLCQKASQKLNALARFAPYIETTKKRMNAFFKSQFNY